MMSERFMHGGQRAPVLILDCAPRVTVTIARSLHRQGIPVDVGLISRCSRRVRSSAIRDIYRLPDYQTSPGTFISALMEVIKAKGHDMLIAASDDALEAITQHYWELNRVLTVNCPPPNIVCGVLDKCKTLEMATECGIPIPRSYTVSDRSDLDALRHKIAFPVILKQMRKTGVRRVPVRSFDDFAQLCGAFNDVTLYKETLLQEFCPGTGVGIETLFWDGEPLLLFQHRRVRELPPAGGVSVVAEAEEVNEQLSGFTTRLLKRIGWSGVAMVEFRHDPATSKSVLMEVNGRYWGSLALSQVSGIDFPYYDWQVCHGQRPALPRDYRVGQRIRWIAGDVLRLCKIMLSVGNECRASQLVRELRMFVDDFLHSTPDAIWSVRDPLPAIMEFCQIVGDHMHLNFTPDAVRDPIDARTEPGSSGNLPLESGVAAPTVLGRK
jgi:predicted ATP-grasp superfamily ATP-dependent carboligase